MTRGTKEHYEIMSQFETAIKTLPVFGKVERQEKDENIPSDQFYTNGQINAMFLAFMRGYALAKCNYQNS